MYASSSKLILCSILCLPVLAAARDAQTLPDACETVGKRVYDLCMASPKADREDCLREYDEAYLRCSKPNDAAAGSETGSGETNLSKNTYRVPYADGTKVHVSRDFYDHNPLGKLDMSGRGGGPYRIVAAAAGTIRFIEDGYSKQQHPERWLRNTQDCFNNFVWIEHANGEWSKYSHMEQWSTTGKAGLEVGDYVAEGTYLGDEGKVGCAWPAHLHFEVIAVPQQDRPIVVELDGKPGGGLKGIGRSHARNPVIAGLSGKIFKDGETYIAYPGPKCQRDDDCDQGEYCNAGVDATRNACLPKKADNETCALVGGGDQCQSGHCRFSRCYTPGSVGTGGTCYTDDACRAGKCSDPGGMKGVCVCQKDEDCDGDEWCDKGLDLNLNQCKGKLAKGASCGKVGSLGNDRKCQSGKCSGFPDYKCK